MNKPDYLAPKSLEEAFETLKKNKDGVKIIAGGTDLQQVKFVCMR